MSAAARFLRQVLLPEIGEEGQRRIGESAANVGGDPVSLAHEVACLYARGAGFKSIEAGPIDLDALAPGAIVERAAAREVLAGARAALAEMRRAVGQRAEGTGGARS